MIEFNWKLIQKLRGETELKKLSKYLCGPVLICMMLVSPMGASADHYGENWKTHHSYYECRDRGYYFVEEQHRHEGSNVYYRTVSEMVLNACPITQSPENNQ